MGPQGTDCGFGCRNLFKDFADGVWEIEFGERAPIFALLVSTACGYSEGKVAPGTSE